VTSVAVIASGAASALGLGGAAYDVGAAGAAPQSALARRPGGKPFGRVAACVAPRQARPRALLELALAQLERELSERQPSWRTQRVGVVIGTSSGGLAALERGVWHDSSYFAPLGVVQDTLQVAPRRLVSLYAACASSTLAVGLALRWLELDYFDLVIAGGYDAESDWVSAGFDSLKATSAAAPRPFRAERDGMALGEGAALLALSRRHDHALGFVRGFSASSDAVHITAPDRTGKSLARAATAALADAGISPGTVDFVSVHGTGTSFNDAAEAAALKLIFGARAAGVVLQAVKPVVGHTLGAAGALEALFALSALARGVLPASLSPGSPMPEMPVRLLEQNLSAPVEHCLKLSTAFGGANAALVLSKSSGSRELRAPRRVHLVATGTPCEQLEPARLEGLLVGPAERLPRSDLLSELAVAAAAEAWRDARARGLLYDPSRTGVIVGSVGSTLEADAAFGARIAARGPEHAEPRRFPATSPNACAGHVAIAFGLGGPSHAVGAGPGAALEALEVAHDWLTAGDADAMLVVSAEQAGGTTGQALEALGLAAPATGAFAVLLSTTGPGPVLTRESIGQAVQNQQQDGGSAALRGLCSAAGLPGRVGFGTVRAPE
jgi:3-oxoacyl-[acyl-carrier-protein] synthase-1/3-oxoacyl-[acyl-carrier-protein] synthase II